MTEPAHEGVAESTEGHKFSWYGDGETKIAANSEFALTYGVKTEVSLGMSTEFSLAAKTEISIGAKLEANVGYAFEFKKDGALEFAKDGGVHYLDSYAANVGASAGQRAAIKILSTAAWVLIGLQSALMISYSIAAVAQKVKDPKDEHLYLPDSKFPMAHLSSILTIATNVGAMLTIAAGRLMDLSETSDPSGVLSMDSTSAVFLGSRPAAGATSAGVTLDATGIELSTANADLRYRKPSPHSSSIIGFQDKPGEQNVAGARLQLNTDGTLQAWGKSLTSTLTESATQKAPTHVLQVTDGTGADKPSYLRTDDSGTFIQAKADTALYVSSGIGVNAVAGDSFVGLSSAKATIGRDGNNLECGAGAVTLAFGNTKLTIDATGINLGGGAISIMAPGGPITSVDLVNLKMRSAEQEALQRAHATRLTVHNAKLQALSKAVRTVNETLITLRPRGKI
ncbi:hypothetical protein [Castellaniella sp. GW247-6E4]|uniref:hypothetical protein n=1 Tax=Castellaniella sp. GW247-6E4 TaxID=3140380 RepID=UPI0033155CE8